MYALPHGAKNAEMKGVALRESFVGGRVQSITGKDEAVTQISIFKGNDPAQWQRNLPSYLQVELGEVYPGIGIALTAHGNNIEKIFTVQPGASPETIRLNIDGGQAMRVNAAGELAVATALGEVTFTKPVAYQDVAGQRTPVEVAYAVAGQKYGFTVGAYDQTQPLVIDPLLASTFLGGSSFEEVVGIAVDSSDNVYVSGITGSSDFPTTAGVYDRTLIGYSDGFIAKLNPSLTTLLAATFLGGSSSSGNEGINSLAIDSTGNIYGSGGTTSNDFPTTTGVYDQTYNGSTGWWYGGDGVIVKLDASLSTLIASTYLGGGGDDGLASLVFDSSGNVFVAGNTTSSNFPVTVGAYDETYNGGGSWPWHDIVIAKLDTSLTTLLASTYLGGSSDDNISNIVLDHSGNLLIGGRSDSADFPVMPGAYDTWLNGGFDAIVAKIDPTLTTLLAATFLGGGNDDSAEVKLDSNDNVYLFGTTTSVDFPTTLCAYDPTYNGNGDLFIARLNSTLTALPVATFLGGSGSDTYRANALMLDSNGNVYIAITTSSTDFPTTPGAYDPTYNGGESDKVVAKFNASLTSLLAATYLGGSGTESVYIVIALDSSGNVYASGTTKSTDFPTTPGAYDTTHNGDEDVFVAKLDTNLSTTVPISGYVRFGNTTGISGVVLQGLPGEPVTNANGFYQGFVPYGWSGTVTPWKASFSFTPMTKTYSNVTTNQANQDYTGVGPTGNSSLLWTK